ncbi:MAG: DegV family protein [Dehalococcoidia bacterium]|nr:DegV family protein [Dehalococcoidia bacterium]
MDTRIITDSVACLPATLAEELGIHVIPVRLAADGVAYRDLDKELPDTQIRRLQEASAIDTTPWSPEHYCREYLQAAMGVDHLVHVVAFSSFTSTMSLARAGASMAQERAPGLRIEVVDSGSTLMAQGFVALSAARTALVGGTIDEIVAAAVAVRDVVRTVVSLGTLRYVARTGRVPRLVSWANTLLGVKPVVGLALGKEEPLGLVRSRSQEMRTLVEKVEAMVGDGVSLHLAVMDTGRPDDGEELLQRLREELHPAESFHTGLSPVSQVVSGPGLLGVAFYAGVAQ